MRVEAAWSAKRPLLLLLLLTERTSSTSKRRTLLLLLLLLEVHIRLRLLTGAGTSESCRHWLVERGWAHRPAASTPSAAVRAHGL